MNKNIKDYVYGETQTTKKEEPKKTAKEWKWENPAGGKKKFHKDMIKIGRTIKKNEKEKWIKGILSLIPKWIGNVVIIKKEIIIYTKDIYNHEVIEFLKKHTNCLYKTLVELTVIDNPDQKKRFEMTYILLSKIYQSRIKVKTIIDEITPLRSITKLYNGANWMERETWDMYGINFEKHPDLRRILTDYGFEGFPLLKDWPLSGYMEMRYDDEQKRVVNEPIEITQEYRNYDMISPWTTREEMED